MPEPAPIGVTMSAYLRTLFANVERAEVTGTDLEPEHISPMEVRLMEAFLQVGLTPLQQYPIGRFFADFYFPEHKLVIEVDGLAYHAGERSGRDDRRDRLLFNAGVKTFRIPAVYVRRDADRCARAVRDVLDTMDLEAMK